MTQDRSNTPLCEHKNQMWNIQFTHGHCKDCRAEFGVVRSERAAWIPVGERTPEVARGEEELVWVCAHRKHNGKRYVFALHWVNRPYDEAAETEMADWVICNDDGDPLSTVGWCNVGCNQHYDEFYMPVENPAEIIAWMPMQKPEAPK